MELSKLETFATFADMKGRYDEIGTLFLQRRKELGLTQQQLGEKVGVSKSEISKIENGGAITFATVEKISRALGLEANIELKGSAPADKDIVHYIVMALGMFARKHKLTRAEACRYLSRFKGIEFSLNNYETEHQLALQQCVDDMAAICRLNGGAI